MFRKHLSLVSSLLRNKHVAACRCSALSDSSRVHPVEEESSIKHADERTKKVGERTGTRKAKTRECTLNDEETLDIIGHVRRTNPDMIDVCPKRLMDICKADNKTNTLCLIDRETAVDYVSLIENDLLGNACDFVAEMNPGFGILTTELLKTGVPLIHLYETNQEFYPVLDAIRDHHPGRLELRRFNLTKLRHVFYQDRITGANKLGEALRGVGHKNWEDDSCMQVVGAISSAKFFGQLVKNLLYRSCLMTYGRPVFYIARYTCENNNRKVYTAPKVLFQLMFDYQFLGTLSRKAFLPWPQRKTVRNAVSDPEEIHVIRLEPKADLYSRLSQEEWITFSFFARHHLQKRSIRVIPEMEKWIPGCGIRLIANDYTIFTQFGELTPLQIVELFKEFKSWPEYKESYFLTSIKDSLNVHNELNFLEMNNIKADE